MIACDTSTLIAYLAGANGVDVEALDDAFRKGALVLPPATVAEVLSNPVTQAAALAAISGTRILDLQPDYWFRVGATRAVLLSKKLKARLVDALIAQSCIDANVALITRDRDFRHYEKHCGLMLA